jgi:hypothetical protein
MGRTLWTYAVGPDDSLKRLTGKEAAQVIEGREVPGVPQRDPGGVLYLEVVAELQHRSPVRFFRPIFSACALTPEAEGASVRPINAKIVENFESELRERIRRAKVQPMSAPEHSVVAELRDRLTAREFVGLRYQSPDQAMIAAADLAAARLGLGRPKLRLESTSGGSEQDSPPAAGVDGATADELLMKLFRMQLPMAPDRPMTDLEGMEEVFGPNWEEELDAEIQAELEAEAASEAEQQKGPEN